MPHENTEIINKINGKVDINVKINYIGRTPKIYSAFTIKFFEQIKLNRLLGTCALAACVIVEV